MSAAEPATASGTESVPAAWAQAALASLIGAVTVAWAAWPQSNILDGLATAVAGVAWFLATVRTALAVLAARDYRLKERFAIGWWDRLRTRLLDWRQHRPWPEVLLVATVVAEVDRHVGVWHTAVLGVLLYLYLFATHLAESGSLPQVLRPQGRMLAHGFGLGAVGLAFVLLPSGAPVWLRLVACLTAASAGGILSTVG